jgi:ATP-dependent helicase HrpA
MTSLQSPASVPEVRQLRRRLSEVTLRDERRLQRRLDGLRTTKDASARQRALSAIATEIEKSANRVQARAASVPPITYPAELPVSQQRDDLLAAIRAHQVVIVAGETGSGKTTQLPKICLELGRGVRGQIGHTQPRRLAARTVAERIASEVGTDLGDTVGYQVRFADHSGDRTLVKLMTDGILLAEIQRDRMLRSYDTLILDEAHERSLNIDFLIGYLKQLLPRRPDLKLIITSATLDPERFARHFDDAPIVEVSGRTYPVEVRYRPLVDEGEPEDEEQQESPDIYEAIGDAVDELGKEGPGDVLVFLSGEREIRDAADALRARPSTRKSGRPDDLEILPLYARLSAAEQSKVFSTSTTRRVVLATNVAETSLTVPGIRYVIDPGTARISRYSVRTKVQRLPIEPISQASANQRKGRCGRVADGICIRLYSEDDFLGRPEFSEPEILRTNLASVILQMTSLGLGDIDAFPFVDPPDRRSIADGLALLHELGAIDPDESDPRKRLSRDGRRLAQLPIDPRYARMLLEADRAGCLDEVLVIVSALSIQDPRERPADKQQAADAMHARFADPASDFAAFLNLWRYLNEQQSALSSNQFRRRCKNEFLHYLRIREWQDLHGQLRSITRNLDMVPNARPANATAISTALLSGLLSHIGLRDPERRDYLGARGARFAVFPGSGLFRKQPQWVMAAELVETSRLWGRMVAKIEPDQVEPLAGHLVKRTYSEPHWEKKRAAAVAFEKVTLYGVPVVASRKVAYGAIDPGTSRELFLRHALVEGDWTTNHAFFAANRQLLEDAEDLEARARRRDLVVDDETLFAFYDARIPADVVSGRHFDSWWKKARRRDPDMLTFTPEMLIQDSEEALDEQYPDVWTSEDLSLPLAYAFEPGTVDDGVTVEVPLTVLNRVRPDDFDWNVPGRREELVTALIKTLPKTLRRNFVPAPQFAAAVLTRVVPGEEPLLTAVPRALRAMTGVTVPPDAWQLDKLPPHLRPTFRVHDESGAVVASSKDLAELQQRLQRKAQRAIASVAKDLERSGARSWADLRLSDGELPRTFADGPVQGYPSLVDEGDSVAIRVLGRATEQAAAMRPGTRRLLLLQLPNPTKALLASMSNASKLALTANPHGSVAALLDDCVGAAIDALVERSGGPAWNGAAFADLTSRVREELPAMVRTVLGTVERILAVARIVDGRLHESVGPALLPSFTDLRDQYRALIAPGFVVATGVGRLEDLLRYLKAMQRRLDKLPGDLVREQSRIRSLADLHADYRQLVAGLPKGRPVPDSVTEIRWMLEELRVSWFAQELGTRIPVSEERILRAIDAALG